MSYIREASVADIETIRQLAEEIWWPCYSSILEAEQIRYMLDHIYAAEVLQKEMESGRQRFLLLHDEDIPQGFASYGPRDKEAGVYKLHKLYVLPQKHKTGYGRQLLEAVTDRVRKTGANRLELNVNRYNPAKSFYEKQGFRILYEEDIPIGSYWMNDYVMGKEL